MELRLTKGEEMKNPVRLFASIFAIAFLIGSLFVIVVVQAHAERVVMLTNGDDVYHANKVQMGSQTIIALAGDDRIWGGVGADTQMGGSGNDRLHGIQPGADTLVGGPGWDVCVVSSIGNDTTRGCEKVIAK